MIHQKGLYDRAPLKTQLPLDISPFGETGKGLLKQNVGFLEIPYSVFPVLLLLTLTVGATLVNSSLFVYQTLASFFLYTLFASALLLYSSTLFWKGTGILKIRFNYILLSFLLWSAYVMICAGTGESGNLKDSVIIFSFLLFLSLVIAFSCTSVPFGWFYPILMAFVVFESMVCIVQFFFSGSSLNADFQVTGTQVNPNITAMFIAMALPAVWVTLFREKGALKYIATLALLFTVAALFLLKCRSAFIGAGLASVIVLNAKFNWTGFLTEKKRVWRFAMVVPVLLMLLFVATKAYEWKKASADGRKMIWRLSWQMIKDKPLTGFGYGLFDRNFNLYQAAWFREGRGTPDETANATHVFMAYNEILENTIEGGIPGLLLFLAVMIAPIVVYLKRKDKTLDHTAAYAGVCTFAAMSLVNFSVQAIPVLCLFVIYAAILSPPVIVFSAAGTQGFRWVLAYRTGSGVLLAIVACYMGFNQFELTRAFMKQKRAVTWLAQGNALKANELFQSLEKRMNTCESYHVQYGRSLLMAGDYEKAAIRFAEALHYTSQPDVFLNLGLCYENLNKATEAEQAYQQAVNITPNRFIPRYLLMNLYINKKDTANARTMAETITAMKVKIPSKEVTFCRTAAANYLQSTVNKTTN